MLTPPSSQVQDRSDEPHVAVPFCSTEMEVNDGGGHQGWSPSISGWLPSGHVVGLHFLDPRAVGWGQVAILTSALGLR